MDDESYFTEKGNNVIMSLKITQQQRMSSLFAPAKILLWLTVSEYGVSEPVYFKSSLAVNKELYKSKWLPVIYRFIQKHHKEEKIVFWLDSVSAH
jgi:hypothetical protein